MSLKHVVKNLLDPWKIEAVTRKLLYWSQFKAFVQAPEKGIKNKAWNVLTATQRLLKQTEKSMDGKLTEMSRSDGLAVAVWPSFGEPEP